MRIGYYSYKKGMSIIKMGYAKKKNINMLTIRNIIFKFNNFAFPDAILKRLADSSEKAGLS